MRPTPSYARGFTLVEIMMTVVIIGILATLAVPVAKRFRNTAIEKTLFNDARAISTAFIRRYGETTATAATLSDLLGADNYASSLTSGTIILQSSGPVDYTTVSAADKWSSPSGMAVKLATASDEHAENAVFRLGNVAYDTSLSSVRQITAPEQGGYRSTSTTATDKDCALLFAVETGALLKKSATSPEQTAAYGQ